MYNKTELNFVDLNSDVQLLILETLDFDDLLSVSETNKYFLSLAETIFKRRFSHKIFEIKSVNHRYADDMNRIYLRDAEETRRALKQFGRWIYKLKVNFVESFEYDQTTKEAISKLINLYCTDTLREIIIYDRHSSFFGQMKKPFKNVESVELVGLFKSIDSDMLHFNEIFPEMKILDLPSTIIKQNEQILQKFPNLIELRVTSYRAQNLKENEIEQIRKLNPQIQRLEVQN